ncbi:hypothetical protein AT15_06870 [Kosmotoga arenicorallina S304]|uniref:N-acetyltransferase domain-containing protein n=1 Tax=Kosmotoga arenicorallina S304 TaxID=1453497 RepID=A0A176K2L3_9BACT|nr:GNAT family N-acetyltransferase [Kosmotoga arenicorallina]OAA31213.1 hypothetical protein AT15_06870 [Kosmotoga arenicorallina S304]
MDKQYVTIEEVSRIELLNLMNEAFSDYVLNFRWNLESLERDLIENGISAKDSAILRISGENVGFFLVSLKGNICRIGLMGMIKKFRGSGYGLEMLDKIVEGCKWKNVNKVILEVPEMDHSSRRFYERYGFRVKRDLVSFYKSLNSNEDIDISLEPLPLKEVQDIAIEASGKYHRKHNWYNDPKTLSHLKFNNFSGILKNDKLLGYCVWSYKDEYVYVMDFGPTAESNYQEIVEYLERSFNGTYEKLLIPWVCEDDVLFSILPPRGYNKLATQKEMELRLTH